MTASIAAQTLGYFNCSCQEGFTLNADGKSCDGTYQRIVEIMLSVGIDLGH